MTSPRRHIVLATLLLSALGLSACAGSDDPTAADDVSLAIGITVEPSSWDPAQAQEGTQIPYYQAVYDTLLLREPDGSLAPMLATDWSYDESMTVLTLQLRDDVTFTDGTDFDADDVVANLAHFAEAGGPQAPTVDAVVDVSATSATEVVITLAEPDPAFLIYLSNAAGFMASSESLADPSLATDPVGSGPYLLDDAGTTVGSEYRFVKRDDYWGTDLPYTEIRFVVIPDVSARLNALRSGQINTAVLSSAAAGQEAASAGFTQVPNEVDWYGFTFFDRGGALTPALGDVRVRQAVNYAIDRDLLVTSFQLGEGSITSQIWGASSLGYQEELDDYYQHDPERARELLAEAGYADGLELSIPVTTIFDDTMLTAVQQMLDDVGITATYVDVPLADFFSVLRSGDHSMTYMQFFQPSDWQLVNQFIAPTATWNVFGTADPRVEDLVAGIQTGDEQAQEVAAQELNQLIVEEAWFVPFYRVVQQLYVDDVTTVVPQAEQSAPSIYNYAPIAEA